jgi:light-regulated signal transduction histidine kinase (bacteriophytochrome)
MDCSAVVGKALANLQAEITASGSEVTVGPLPTVSAVEQEVMRLFQNLIGNTLKYREETKPVKIQVAALGEGGHWVFSVAATASASTLRSGRGSSKPA